jgi:hypothetical protein
MLNLMLHSLQPSHGAVNFILAQLYTGVNTGEEPQRATRLSAGELLHQIAVPDARTGHYRFDEEAIGYLEEYLGVFLGYMSGPLPVSAITKE